MLIDYNRNDGKVLDLAWKEPPMSESRNKIAALKDESNFVPLKKNTWRTQVQAGKPGDARCTPCVVCSA